MEEFELSCILYEFNIWTQLHEIIFIHDCLDYFPNSCNWAVVLSRPFCLTFPTHVWLDRHFIYIDIFLKENGGWIQAHQRRWLCGSMPPVSVGILPSMLIALAWQVAQTHCFGIGPSIFRIRTSKNFFMSCSWGSSPQRRFVFSFIHPVMHQHASAVTFIWKILTTRWSPFRCYC